MASHRKEPSWISLAEILAIHEELLAVYGGSSGVRDIGLLISGLDRARNNWAYEPSDLFKLAAIYADGIISNHPFVDGNKRTGFVAAILFLESNTIVFSGPEPEAVSMTLGLADKSLTKEVYAAWLKANSKRH